jgi:hypothetical protein
MRSGTLEALGLGGLEDRVAGTALLARTAARHSLSVEGASQHTSSLALLSISALALMDATTARRAAAGLADALAGRSSPLVPLLAGLAPRAPEAAPEPRFRWSLDGIEDGPARRDGAVFALVAFRAAQLGLPVPVDWAEAPWYWRGEVERQRSLPVGRLGIPVSRWLALTNDDLGQVRSAALEVLRRGADEMRIAMSDAYHWRMLHSGLAPIEPELLLAAMVLHAAAQLMDEGYGSEVERELEDDEVLRAVFVVAGDLAPEAFWRPRALAEHWDDREVDPPERLVRWQEAVRVTPWDTIAW